MKNPENMPNLQLESIIALAKTNTDEGWARVDDQLEQFCNDSSFLEWARDNTENEEIGLRDLAATILEASDTILTKEDVNNLKDLMEEEGYPGFRAACALAKRIVRHELPGLKNLVTDKLKEFTEDESVSDIANEYLESMGE